MATKWTEKDLNQLNLEIDPDNPSEVHPISKERNPDDDWHLDKLGQYAAASLATADRLEAEALQLSRRSTLQLYRAGKALAIAHKRLKSEGEGWCAWLDRHDIAPLRAYEAEKLFENAPSEEAIAGMTPTEAKTKFKAVKPRKSGRATEGKTAQRERKPRSRQRSR